MEQFWMAYNMCIRVWMGGYNESPDVDEYEVAPRYRR